MPLWLALLATAAAYWVTGRLGLLLAIPPGYATAVWPASGIALAAVLLWGWRVWPGILLGSFLINIGTSFEAAAWLRSVIIAATIGSGAALQAMVGGWLIRRYVGYRNILTQEMDSVRLLLLAGPVSCVINALVGVTTLWLAGLLPAKNYLFNWWTWWVGDSIGVLIFTPLVLIWALRPWRRWLRRQVFVSIPLVLMFILVVALFFTVSWREESRIRTEFEGWSDAYRVELVKDVEIYLTVLQAIEGLFVSSQEVDADEYRVFTERILRHAQGLKGLGWAPLVRHAERARYEAMTTDVDRKTLGITEYGDHGRLRPAGARDEYIVVHFIAPEADNQRALGYDMASDQARRQAIVAARDTGRPVATSTVRLVQAPDQAGMLIYHPVYQGTTVPAVLADRHDRFRGVAYAALVLEEMLQSSAASIRGTGLQVRLYDDSEGQGRAPIYSTNLKNGEIKAGGLYKSVPLELAGRQWRLDFYVSPDYLVAHRSWQAWVLLAGGLLFTGLLGLFLLVVVGRTTRIEELVQRRTGELQDSNHRLQDEVTERMRLEGEAQRKAAELEQKNEELEQFAYVASHDLQAPLRTVSGFAQLLQREYAEKLGAEGGEFLGYIINGTSQMHRLIGDLLQLSRVRTRAGEMASVDCTAVLARVCESLRLDLERTGAEVQFDALPAVWGDAGQLAQLFQNLIGNSIKFQSPGVQPRVQITAVPEARFWHFRVSDNGIGMPADQLQKIFVIFARLHTAEEYPGTGIGLAICKKIVERHGGRIWAESTPGVGSVFHFTLPADEGAAAAAG